MSHRRGAPIGRGGASRHRRPLRRASAQDTRGPRAEQRRATPDGHPRAQGQSPGRLGRDDEDVDLGGLSAEWPLIAPDGPGAGRKQIAAESAWAESTRTQDAKPRG